MKKNRSMRLATLLLALTLITSCFVGGTFAKYTTSESAKDQARVAKWGIELSVEGGDELFVTEYDEGADRFTVVSQNTEDLVAPGTKNDTGVTFKLTGKPEVATKVTASLGATEDVFLKNGEDIYYPVEFTLTHTYGDEAFSIAGAANEADVTVATEEGKDVITGTLAEIEAVLVELTEAMSQLDPNYPYDDTFTLTWAWEFGDPTNNELDTTLGNLAAEVNPNSLVDDEDYNLTVAYDFSITVEQID